MSFYEEQSTRIWLKIGEIEGNITTVQRLVGEFENATRADRGRFQQVGEQLEKFHQEI